MEEDANSLHNCNPFLLKEDIFSAYLNMNNPNLFPEPDKCAQEDFFFRPETNYLNKYFDNDKLSNISQGEASLTFNKYDISSPKHQDIPKPESSPKKNKGDNIEAIPNKNGNNNKHNSNNFNSNLFKAELTMKENNLKVNFQKKEIKEVNNENGKESSDKEIKLLKNRLSARKCRQKKKNYIKELENEVNEYKSEIEKFKAVSKKELSFENYATILEDKEKELETMSNKKKYDTIRSEYMTNQQRLLKGLFIRQIKLMMPIEMKLFQNKFIKMAQFEDDDSNETILGKINNNIQMLNELYDFKKKSNSSGKDKEKVPYKLYMFYQNLKKYTESFISNIQMI